ncbi:MAG: hypothetical protein J6Y54_03675 [Lentisphaeria bacterium]|nr:hypothetical protein [Lentisphaeria bacterium]
MNTVTLFAAVCTAGANPVGCWQRILMYVAIAAFALIVVYLLLSPRTMM